jgi:hypothetical protein
MCCKNEAINSYTGTLDTCKIIAANMNTEVITLLPPFIRNHPPSTI